ncbi:hypothetical protein [[Mycoplasma] cavipharyngis]|uniref:hypothetical protein n=1 Tax=[Mycoplasma] cavipharyngis TaxID=92757 RepID=UPI0037038356
MKNYSKNIKYFALGGQDEKAKYSGVLEIDDQIFILNTGIGDDITNQFGISKVIPDLNFLKENKKRIKGIFLGTPEFLNIGSLPFFLETLEDVPIFTSKIGKTIITSWFSRKSKSENFRKKYAQIKVCRPLKTITVGNVEVTPFKVYNSMPDSFGWAFKTTKGSIVFIDQFILANSKKPGFESQIHYLPRITQNSVLALIVGLQNVGKNLGYAVPNYQNYGFLKRIIANSTNRILIACYDHDFMTVLNAVEIARNYGLKVMIYSNTWTKIFNQMVKMGYVNIDHLVFIDSKKVPNDQDLIVIITGNQDRLYHKMHKILTGEDQNISFNSQDLFVLNTITQSGIELREARLLDEISRKDVATEKIKRTIHAPIAGNEDHKFLVNLLNPKWIFPIIGYHKDFNAYLEAVSSVINPHIVRFLDNGEVAILDQKSLPKTFHYPIYEQYVDFNGVVDIKTSALLERQNMYTYGLVNINFIYCKEKKCFSEPEISSIGLISSDHDKNSDLDQLIIKMVKNELLKNLALAENRDLDLKALKLQLKKIIQRLIDRQLQKKPLVLITIGQFNVTP